MIVQSVMEQDKKTENELIVELEKVYGIVP